MNARALTVCLLGKSTDPALPKVEHFLRRHAKDVRTFRGTRREPLPALARAWAGDLIVSYLSPWVVPPELLSRARVRAINFHPGPPEYPGIGCTNFALYEGATRYGVTCHDMSAVPDTGPILAVRRFACSKHDTVLSLTERAHAHLLTLAFEILESVFIDGKWPESLDRWTRPPFRRSELDALCRIAPTFSDEEVRRRVRAVTYPGMPGAYVEVAGHRFLLESEGN